MIWAIVIGIVGFILFRFYSDYKKDDVDLSTQKLHEKFAVVVELINQEAYNGLGSVTILDKRSFNLYLTGNQQIVQFIYSTGILTIIWKYKYYQKEVIHEKTFENVRNLSIFEQQNIAEAMISEMRTVIENHQLNVLGNSQF
ncbi:hypothetical protein [Faecalibacter bovis]|uniref:DUF4230 domain-containing protein n=1 Tax=Faecalibacter bovis TaxID=2898187 RepID=A0ABX7XAC4_9FLAO|nr:hypothetical protein [Faecalibacter bovis]QTV04846.1 hypothetical protein J9309_08550 [Faecalibacter bovis]